MIFYNTATFLWKCQFQSCDMEKYCTYFAWKFYFQWYQTGFSVISHKLRQGMDFVACGTRGIRKISWNFGAPCSYRQITLILQDILFPDILIFCLLGSFWGFWAILGYFRSWGGTKEDFWGLLIWTDNFHFVRYFLLLGGILSLLGPYQAILGAGPRTLLGDNAYRLTSFVF